MTPLDADDWTFYLGMVLVTVALLVAIVDAARQKGRVNGEPWKLTTFLGKAAIAFTGWMLVCGLLAVMLGLNEEP